MKTSTKLLASLVLSSSLIFTGVMAADHEKKGNHQGFKIERLTKKLSLTEAQVISIQALVDEKKANKVVKVKPKLTKEERKAKKLAMKEKFKAMMEAPEFDEAAIRTKIAERSEKRTNRQVGKMRMQHAIYQVLNEEQREKFLKMMAKKHKKMNKKKGMKKKRAEKAE